MAPARGRRRAQEDPEPDAEPEQEQGGEEDLISLQFNEELTWRPGRPIPPGTLLTRLDKLSKELVDMDQDTVNTASLTDVAQALGSRNLIAHKDAGVKAKTASCLVEILRLCAPDAPFTEEQIQLIFALFIKFILPALQDPQHSYYRDLKHVLESLSEVKSILLLDDVEHGDELLAKLFSCCFDTVSATSSSVTEEQIPKDVVYHMTELLITLVDEGPSLTGAVMEIIMAQFLRAAPPGGKTDRGEQNGSQSTLLLKTEPEAYLMAKTICNSSPDKMSRYVSQYFSDVIMDASGFATKANGHRQGDDGDEEDQPAGPSESDLKELKKAHLLIRELWRACPLVLQNVIPQLEAELNADNVHLRQIATEALGDLISGIGAAGPPPPPTLDPAMYPPLRLADETPTQQTASVLTKPLSPQSFAQTHAAAYHSFIGRRNDKIPAIRSAWTTAAGYILSTSAGGIGLSREEEADLVKGLGEKLNDTDEKVRLAAVKAIELFNFRDIITKLGALGGVDKEGSVLGSLADRCRDTRPAVRVEAMVLLGKLWAVAAGEIAAGQEAVTAALAGIPSRIVGIFFINDPEMNILLDRVIFECLVPLAYPALKGKAAKGSGKRQSGAVDHDRIRAERILLLAKALNESSKKAFLGMQARQPQFAKVMEVYLKQCEAFNGGVMDEDERRKTASLEKAISYLVQFFPDAAKTKSDLHKFAKANDRRNYQLIRYAIDSDADFKTIRRAINELVNRIQGSSSAATLDTLIPLIYRSACLMFNRSHLPTIMDYSKANRDGLGAISHEILNEISTRNPEMFKTQLAELCKGLVEHVPSERRENDLSAADILRACSSYSKKYPQELPEDRAFVQAIISYALYGKPVETAKFAVNILLARKDEKSMVNATSLLQKVMKDWNYGAPHFLNRLATVSQLELQAPKVTLDFDDDILDMTVQKLLLQVRTDASDKDPGWVEDADTDEELQAKLLALKVLVNRIRSTEDEAEAKERAQPIFKLLRSLIVKGGEICKVKDTPRPHKARLRLRAAQLLLKLCTQKHFDHMLSQEAFDELAYVTQDPEPGVRRGFVEKLQKYLVQSRLNYRYFTIIFLTAFEPMAEFKQRCETWIRSRAQVMEAKEPKVMGAVMAWLLSLLAHHPDYSTEVGDLVDHARYIVYFVSNVATETNLGLLSKMAERVKQTRDAVKPAESENLYVLSDLAQAVIRKWQQKKNWSLENYPDKIGLPLGPYAKLPSHEVAMAIANKSYIPDEVEQKLDDILRPIDRKKKRKSTDERPEGHPVTKKVKAAPTTQDPKERTKEKAKAAKPAQTKKPGKKPSSAKPKKTARSSAAATSADRRRSGRAKGTGTKYAERDSSEDDEEMWLGVAEWEYLSENPDGKSEAADSEDEEADSDDEEPAKKPKARSRPAAKEDAPPEESSEEEAHEQAEESEAEAPAPPPPQRSNGRKAAAQAAAPKSAPAKSGRVVPKLKESVAEKAAKTKAAEAKAAPPPRAKRAARGKAKDVYDMDLDDDDD